MVLFLKLLCGTQNSQKKEVSNLYGEALFSGKLHQHTLKNPNGRSGAGTCNYWSVYSHKAISTSCHTVLQICYYFQRTAECIVSTGKDVDKNQHFTINIYVGSVMLMVSLKTAEEDVDVTDPTE